MFLHGRNPYAGERSMSPARTTTFKTTQTRMIHQMFTSKVNRTPWRHIPQGRRSAPGCPQRRRRTRRRCGPPGGGRGAPGLNPSKRRRMPWSLSPWKKLAFRLLDTTEDRVGGDAALLHIGAEGAAVDQVPGLVAGFDDQRHVHTCPVRFPQTGFWRRFRCPGR